MLLLRKTTMPEIELGEETQLRQFHHMRKTASHLPIPKCRVYLPIQTSQPPPISCAPLVLASKSNYQCIVDGTNSQFGLHYPDHLVKGVISKRKSHSAAERGRRDRMKNALQRMSELLPQKGHVSGEDDEIPIGNSAGEATNDTDARQGSVGSQATCKASIVEMAIDYIQSLQKEVLELNSKLDEQGASIRAVMITLRLHRIKVEGHHLQMAPCRKENQASSTKEDKNGYGIG